MEHRRGGLCRRCGVHVAAEAAVFTHYVFLKDEDGIREVALSMCHPCGVEFATVAERDHYARLGLFG